MQNVVTPLNKRIIVKPEEAAKMTKGGLHIPETVNKKAPTRGRVVSIAWDCSNEIKDKLMKVTNIPKSPSEVTHIIEYRDVMFSKYSGVEVFYKEEGEDKEYQIIKEEDILAVIIEQKE